MPAGSTFGKEPADGHRTERRPGTPGDLLQTDERSENEGIDGKFGGLTHDQR